MRGYSQRMSTLLVPPPLKKMFFPPLATSKYLEISGSGCREGWGLMSSSHPARALPGPALGRYHSCCKLRMPQHCSPSSESAVLLPSLLGVPEPGGDGLCPTLAVIATVTYSQYFDLLRVSAIPFSTADKFL